MIPSTSRARNYAVVVSLLAAFLWASYYGFVLGIGTGASSAALLLDPFLFGGVFYGLWALYRGSGREYVRLFASPPQWGRAGMLLGAQIGILLLTLRGAAVDAALLSLVGDVALTPLVVMLVFNEGRARLRSVVFVLGILLSGAGASLTILAGGSVTGLSGAELLAAPTIPLLVAGYFVGSARVGRTLPISAVAAQSYLACAILALVAVVLYDRSFAGLFPSDPVALALVLGAAATSFFIAPLLYFDAIERAGIFLPSLLMAAIPVFTLAFTATLLGRVPPWLGLLGVPVAVVGAILAVRGSHAAEAPTPTA
ncbi:MAG TPA: DMT family transporter [Thermoplasmata archaeon]|nr:DMT family transporter [Thermoplasmata archaeon]